MKKRINKKNSNFIINLLKFQKSKKGQETLGISFGVIFSIILIIFFIVIAFIVIKSFLRTQDCAQIGIFIDKFEADVKRTWNSQFDTHTFKGNLPGSIDYVCFANLTRDVRGEYEQIGFDIGLFEGKEANTFFYPIGKTCEIPYKNIPHLDIEKIAGLKNPNCIPVQSGRIDIVLRKDLNDRFVDIEI